MRHLILILVFMGWIFGYDATLEIVKKGVAQPGIVLEDGGAKGFDAVFAKKFQKMLIGDLKVSSNFRVLDDDIKVDYDGTLLNDVSAAKKVDLALRYKIQKTDNGQLEVMVKAINLKGAQAIYEKKYDIATDKYPFLSHKIIVDLSADLGLGDVSWMERNIIFSKYTTPKESEIVVGDYTLTYQKSVIKGGLNVFPKWASDKQEKFYYTSMNEMLPTLYAVNLSNGKKEKILSGEGMVVCSDVSKNGDKLLLTLAPNDQPDIYIYDVSTKKRTQVTNYKGIDVNGNFVDNDTKVVFVSDRMGYPNIYETPIGKDTAVPMVDHGKNNNSCSSFENYIVYSSREGESEFKDNTFNLYLISTQTNAIRQLTATGKNMFPRFSSDGDSIIYIKHMQNQSALGIMRLSGNKSYTFALNTGKIQSIDW